MMISTKGRYALRVLVDLAEHGNGEYIPLKDIAQRQEISEKYLESIIVTLSKAKFLDGLRGKGGGYKLTKSPELYTVGSILKLVEGSLSPVSCLGNEQNHCMRTAECRTLGMWREFNQVIDHFFENITLADLMKSDADGSNFFVI